MRAAFVLVIRSGAGPVPPEVLHRLRTARAPAPLGLQPAAQLAWSSRGGTAAAAAWCERVDSGRTDWAWQQTAEGLAVVTSPIRRIGEPWMAADRSPSILASCVRGFSPAVLDELDGAFSGIVVDADGQGVAVTDPLAVRGLYVGHSTSYSVVASSPALVAGTIHGGLAAAPLDPWGVCGLAYTKHRIGERTGYEGVTSMPIGSYLRLSDEGVACTERPPPWRPGDPSADASPSELLDRAHGALEEVVTAAAGMDVHPRYADLTGGKDSRLVLAATVTARVHHRFAFRTDGPPTILDVEIASELAEIAGVRWVRGADIHRPRADPSGWLDRMTRYVQDTAGICNIADTSARFHRTEDAAKGDPPLRVNGLSGELLRSMLGFELPDERALVRRFDRHFGHLDLLRPDAMLRYRAEWMDELLSGRVEGGSWNDRHDVFLLCTQVRANFGPRSDLLPGPRLMPLSALGAVRSAYGLGATARIDERLHREIIGRASPRLVEHRLAKGEWRRARPAPAWATPQPRRRPWQRRPDLFAARLDRPSTRPPVTMSSSLPASTYNEAQRGHGDQVATVRELLGDRSNPAWEIIDPSAVSAAADGYAQLSRPAQVELLGAVTAALWLTRSR